MTNEQAPNPYEREPKIVTVKPSVESLLDTDNTESAWPKDILENPKRVEEAAARNRSIESLGAIFARLPKADMDVDEAVEQGLVGQTELTVMYRDIMAVLESDTENDRMVLYFPFELIPRVSWLPESGDLRDATRKFMNVYMKYWERLLSKNSVRANFVDGDVLEIELRIEKLERVTKAVHLIPKLMEKGYISIANISELLESGPNPVLSKTIGETLPVLVDMGLITQTGMDELVQQHHLEVSEKKIVDVPPELITPARAKWLREKDEIPLMTERSGDELDMPFAKKEERLKTDIAIVRSAVEQIESNPELNKLVYPVAILFGSRIKGYSKDDADIDVAVFVKPGTDIGERQKLQSLLAKTFDHEKIKGGVVEFWLEETDGELHVKDFPEPDNRTADSTWSHVLFEGVWIGSQNVIKEMHEMLLSGYLYSKDKTIADIDARKIWLEEMERDTLQYRLMHKGYARFFPKQGGMHTEHSDNIDGNSMFYDSGFRRLATKLFLSRVFLPQLDRPENK